MNLKIIFAGTPDFAVPTLQAIINAHHDVVAVYTQPDRKAGRGQTLTASPIKQLALANNIPVEQPENFKSDFALQQLKQYQADIMIVVAYGLLLPESVLTAFPYGCINVHASLLPRWRGAAPIQRAILAGDNMSGVCIMQMEKGLDTGPVFCMESCSITSTDTGKSLHDKLALLGANTLIPCLEKITSTKCDATPQDNTLATYAHKLTKQEAKIDWHDSAINIDRKIRAFNAWPVAFTEFNNETVRIWQSEVLNEHSDMTPGTIIRVNKSGLDIATRENILRIITLQFPGGKPITAAAILNAKKDLLVTGKQFN